MTERVYIQGGFLEIGDDGGPDRPGHPIAPGRPGRPSRPDNSLPDIEGPVDPGFGIELPPVINGGPPLYVDNGLPFPPTYPVRPDQDLPRPPSVWPRPPSPVDPNYGVGVPLPGLPTLPIYRPAPGSPNQDLPLPPGAVWPPLPPAVTGKLLCLTWIVGVGYRWTCIDTSLKPSHPISGGGETVEHPIAPTAQPKRF